MNVQALGGETIWVDDSGNRRLAFRTAEDGSGSLFRYTGTHPNEGASTTICSWTAAGVVSFPGGVTLSGEAAVAPLTDNSGGTADNTVAAMPDPADTPASVDALRDDIVANLLPPLRNNVADLTAKVNAILTRLGIPAA